MSNTNKRSWTEEYLREIRTSDKYYDWCRGKGYNYSTVDTFLLYLSSLSIDTEEEEFQYTCNKCEREFVIDHYVDPESVLCDDCWTKATGMTKPVGKRMRLKPSSTEDREVPEKWCKTCGHILIEKSGKWVCGYCNTPQKECKHEHYIRTCLGCNESTEIHTHTTLPEIELLQLDTDLKYVEDK
jgi:hypothetical protein